MKTARWGDVCRLHYGKALRNYAEEASENQWTRVYGTNGPIGWTEQPLSAGPGVIIGRKGAYRGVHFAPDPFFVIDTAYYLELITQEIDLRWAYYKLLTVDINKMDVGAAIPTTNREQFYAVEFAYPPLMTQLKIADILSAYDQLIENNRRRMALVEEAARHLYREWFVRLHFPGHKHARVLNGVPQGWTKGFVSDFYNTASGGTPSRKVPEFFGGDIPWVKTKELANRFIIHTEEKITDAALKQSSAKIFPEHSVLVAMYGATVGQLGILASPAATNQACCALMPKDARASYIHAYLFFRENKEQLMRISAGAAQNNVSQEIIRQFRMLMPPKTLIDTFSDSVRPLFEQWLNLQRQNEGLVASRDLLLPKLMSGRILIPTRKVANAVTA